MKHFYVGASELSALTLDVPVPAGIRFCLSHRRMQRRDRKAPFPRATHRWMLDSGSFGYCNASEPLPSAASYVAALRRYDREIGNLDWAAQRDLMCEPWMLAKTGRTVEQNQAANKADFWLLHELWWQAEERDHERDRGLEPGSFRFDDSIRLDLTNFPVKPTLQGWEPEDYWRDVEGWYAAGVKLHEVDVVGLGSVCRRAATKPIRKLIEDLSGFLDLHGFGLKTDALAMYGPVLPTADSHAWSAGTRYKEDRWYCKHGYVKWERNCPIHSIEWGWRTLTADDHVGFDWQARWTGSPDFTTRPASPVHHEQLQLV